MCLRTGGGGAAFKVRDFAEATNVVKITHAEGWSECQGEHEILAKLRHPHVTQVHGFLLLRAQPF